MTKGITGRKRVQIIEIIKIQVIAFYCETWENCFPDALLLINNAQNKCTYHFFLNYNMYFHIVRDNLRWLEKKIHRLEVKMLVK